MPSLHPVADAPTRRGEYVAVLLLGRAADSATTLYGLAQPGVYERNPAVAWLLDAFGTGAGLVVANVLAVGAVVVAAEVAVRLARRGAVDEGVAALAVALCYLPFAVVSFVAAVHNVGIIVST